MVDKTITCKCPKCGGRVYDYIRKGAVQYRQLTCHECKLRFKINLPDFFKEAEVRTDA